MDDVKKEASIPLVSNLEIWDEKEKRFYTKEEIERHFLEKQKKKEEENKS